MTGFYDFIEMSQHLPLIYLAVGVYLILWIFSHNDHWQAFLASIDTNGGHVITLLLLLVIGYRMYQSDATAGGQLMTGAQAALFILLNSKRPIRTGDPSPDAESVRTTTITSSTSATPGPAAAPPVIAAPPAVPPADVPPAP